MIKTALVDMDGVIVDFVRGALAIHGINKPVAEFYEPHRGEFFMTRIIGLTEEQFFGPMGELFWANLPWMPDGQQILRLVEARFGMENVVLASSPCEVDGCVDGKRRWIRNHLPRHYHRTSSQMFGSRKQLMANSETLLVDDHDSNIDLFKATRGGHVVHVPRLWNRLHTMAPAALDVVREQLALV